MGAPVVTLLTDYGLSDEFVGVCHGVIARICPAARIIDITHQVPPHEVGIGAVLLANAIAYLPAGVHVAIVDPTVGSERRAVALALAGGHALVGPDNGVLWPAAQACGGVLEAVDISQSPVRLEPVSATFHGRDLFCPVAAAIAAGRALHELGTALDPGGLVRLALTDGRIEDGALVATVINVDRFGNAQLAAAGDACAPLGVHLGDGLEVRPPSGARHAGRLARTFADAAPGELIAYADAAGRLALACNAASAAERLGLAAGEIVTITPSRT